MWGISFSIGLEESCLSLPIYLIDLFSILCSFGVGSRLKYRMVLVLHDMLWLIRKSHNGVIFSNKVVNVKQLIEQN
jgi:hypothetical protein